MVLYRFLHILAWQLYEAYRSELRNRWRRVHSFKGSIASHLYWPLLAPRRWWRTVMSLVDIKFNVISFVQIVYAPRYNGYNMLAKNNFGKFSVGRSMNEVCSVVDRRDAQVCHIRYPILMTPTNTHRMMMLQPLVGQPFATQPPPQPPDLPRPIVVKLSPWVRARCWRFPDADTSSVRLGWARTTIRWHVRSRKAYVRCATNHSSASPAVNFHLINLDTSKPRAGYANFR